MLKYFYIIIRSTLGFIFLYSGLTKILEPEVFAVLIDSYGLIPEPVVYPSALLLIMLEIAAGTGLLFDIKWSLELLTGLLIIFICVLSYGIIIGLDIDCGCFGKEEAEYKAFHGLRSALYRDIIMAGGIIYMYLWRYCNSHELISANKFLINLSQRGKKWISKK